MKQYRNTRERTTSRRSGALIAAILGAAFVTTLVSADSHLNNLRPFDDPTGRVRTVSTSGEAEVNNAFFQSLGTNGRSCVTCHQASDAWTVTPEHIRARFDARRNGSHFQNRGWSQLSQRRRDYTERPAQVLQHAAE